MQVRNNKTQSSRALTLLETIMAMAIMTIIFAAVVPQIRVVQNSWDTTVGTFETLQNGRVLIDHLNRNLSKANRITAVSGPSETNGYIEFLDNNANNVRYDIGVNNYVEFGLVGNLYDLAGPVSQLLFTCYDGIDFTTPITDVNSIRFIKVQTILANPAKLDQDTTFSTQAYIRTNALPSVFDVTKPPEPWFEFITTQGMEPALAQIDSTHYLCVYRGGVAVDKGMSVVLEVDTDTWKVSQASTSHFEYESEVAKWPALAQINQEYYLCAYQGRDDDGWVKILNVYIPHWTISTGANLEFDTSMGKTPTLERIDQEHYLCAYTGPADDGWAVVLSTNSPYYSISRDTPFKFDTSQGLSPALSQIDSTHYLCTYTGPGEDGWAVVLVVNTGTWAITKEMPFEFDNVQCYVPALAKIDDTHYLCAYTGLGGNGLATVLTVDTGTWTITKQTPSEFDISCITPALSKIDHTHYLCAYTGFANDGWAVVLNVDSGNWTVSKGTLFEFDTWNGASPALAKIDENHYFCVYAGLGDDGFAGVLAPNEEILP